MFEQVQMQVQMQMQVQVQVQVAWNELRGHHHAGVPLLMVVIFFGLA
jgi:hypothetical protein